MAQQNYYKANLRDLQFLLFEQFHMDELLGKAPYANWDKDQCLTVLEEAYGWVQRYLGPLNASGDAEGCKLVGLRFQRELRQLGLPHAQNLPSRRVSVSLGGA